MTIALINWPDDIWEFNENLQEMAEQKQDQREYVNKVYDYASKLMIDEKRKPAEAQPELTEHGLDEQSASIVVENLYNKSDQQKGQ